MARRPLGPWPPFPREPTDPPLYPDPNPDPDFTLRGVRNLPSVVDPLPSDRPEVGDAFAGPENL